MGIFNWLMHRQMKGEAKRLAKIARESYDEKKKELGNVSEQEIIISMSFNEDKLKKLTSEIRTRIKTCCKTVNGYCYMMALDVGEFKKLINFRSLQFTGYMDRELESVGFPKQSNEQKGEILKVMGLDLPGWEDWANAIKR
jgi:hypothetical protein